MNKNTLFCALIFSACGVPDPKAICPYHPVAGQWEFSFIALDRPELNPDKDVYCLDQQGVLTLPPNSDFLVDDCPDGCTCYSDIASPPKENEDQATAVNYQSGVGGASMGSVCSRHIRQSCDGGKSYIVCSVDITKSTEVLGFCTSVNRVFGVSCRFSIDAIWKSP